jgi:transposase
MVHVGVDLDKRSSQIAVLTEDGEIVQQRLPNEAVGLEKFFAQLPPQTPIALEASGTWWWLVDLLERLGHRPVLSNPKQTKAIAAARLKNDRVDAERLALLLRGDLLPTVWIPPTALREARELVRHRIQLVWLRSVIRNRLQAMLARRKPAADVGQELAHAAWPARAEAAALDGGAASDPRGLCGPAAHLGRPDPAIGC